MLVRGSDGHRERLMITGICYGRAPIGAAWSVGVLLVGAGPVGLVQQRPRRPEAAHPLSLHRAAGITRPIESASTLMPPGMLGGPKAAAAQSARCTWVCVDVHTECASPETHLKANVSRRLKRARRTPRLRLVMRRSDSNARRSNDPGSGDPTAVAANLQGTVAHAHGALPEPTDPKVNTAAKYGNDRTI